MSAAHVTYAMVKPRLDDEIERIRTSLTTCEPAALAKLQAQAAALRQIDLWFSRGATDTQIFGESV